MTQKTTRHEEGQRLRKFEETGSGVIVRSDKDPGLYVLTNHHVVEGGKLEKIRIFLQDGRALSPERIWSDSEADIAVLKLDRDDLPAARLGNSDEATVGSWVVALGSPFGLTHSVSQGIISARAGTWTSFRTSRTRIFSRPTRPSTRATPAVRWST